MSIMIPYLKGASFRSVSATTDDIPKRRLAHDKASYYPMADEPPEIKLPKDSQSNEPQRRPSLSKSDGCEVDPNASESCTNRNVSTESVFNFTL